LIYGLKYASFCEYDKASEVYAVDMFEGLPAERDSFYEMCSLDPRLPDVKGKHYAPEGWEQLKQIVKIVAKEVGMRFDLSKIEKGWSR
jgi:hypothetical protein